jgi:hypothetical protein
VPGDFVASADWGDGTQSASDDGTGSVSIVQNADGSFSVLADHVYAQAGSYGITVSIRDTAGNGTLAVLTATVNDAALSASAGSFSATEGLDPGSQVLATFTDANPNASVGDFIPCVTWGDTSPDAGPISIIQNADGSFSVVADHLYAEAGAYNVTVTVTDIAGSTVSATLTATVSDAALTAVPGSFQATAGVDPGSQVLATFTDANPNPSLADFSATVTWGDNSGNSTGDGTGLLSIVQNANGSFSVLGDHTYANTGSYSILVTLSDVGGSSTFVVFPALVNGSTTA